MRWYCSTQFCTGLGLSLHRRPVGGTWQSLVLLVNGGFPAKVVMPNVCCPTLALESIPGPYHGTCLLPQLGGETCSRLARSSDGTGLALKKMSCCGRGTCCRRRMGVLPVALDSVVTQRMCTLEWMRARASQVSQYIICWVGRLLLRSRTTVRHIQQSQKQEFAAEIGRLVSCCGGVNEATTYVLYVKHIQDGESVHPLNSLCRDERHGATAIANGGYRGPFFPPEVRLSESL